MKKLIASLMAVTIASTAGISVVACSKGRPPHPIPTKFRGGLEYENYKDDELNLAYNGSGKTVYAQLSPLNSLLYQIDNLFSLTQSQYTKGKKINSDRVRNIGMDGKFVNEGSSDDHQAANGRPSVDGLYFGEGYEGLTQDKFYANFENTHINSLDGLYRLYEFDKNNSGEQLGLAAQQSLDVFKTAYEGNDDAHKFLDSFLNLTNQSDPSSWNQQVLSSTKSAKILDSQILSYNRHDESEGDKKTTTYQYTPTGGRNDLGKVVGFTEVNTKSGKEDEGKIGDNAQGPFDLLMLPTSANIAEKFEFNTDEDYPTDEEKQEKLEGNKHWDIRTDDSNWDITAYETSKDDKVKGYIKTNESMIVPVDPFDIELEYTTNLKNDDATKYSVKITIENLKAVFQPMDYAAAFDDSEKDGESRGNHFVKWQFTHYQFSETMDTYHRIDSASQWIAGTGNLSGLYISNLEINKK